jgi:hypothetical protein
VGFLKDMKTVMKASQQMAANQAAMGYPPGGYVDPAAAQAAMAAVIDPTAMMPPPSEFVKRQVCVFCGAPKQLPSVREWLYCDFCGQLMDYDLRVASINGFKNPDSAQFAQASNQVQPMIQQALAAGDRARYVQLQNYFYEMMVTYARWSAPPRAWKDEAFKKRWIAFQAEQQAALMFDQEYKRLHDEMVRVTVNIRWQGGNMLGMAAQMMGGGAHEDAWPKADPNSVWPMVDVLMLQAERQKQIVHTTGLSTLDPDMSPDSLTDRMLRSGIAQGWLRYLEPTAGQELINRLGVSHEFFHPTVVADKKGCGGCGGTMHVAPGATFVVCDGCGLKLDLGAGDMECTGCGGHIAIPDGQPTAQCPFCRAEVRRL